MSTEPPNGPIPDGDHDENPCPPHNFTLARPVEAAVGQDMSEIPFASKVQQMPMHMSRLRAVIELLLLIAFTVMGAIAVFLIFQKWPMQDPRWHSVCENIGLGLFAVASCALMLRIAGHKAITIGWSGKEFFTNIAIGLGAFVLNCLLLICRCL